MEFATENYLNELLLNTEANGFESAKEAFYECIANEGKLSDAYDYHVTGGAFQAGMTLGGMAMGYGRHSDKDPSNARQAAGAIIALPIGILTLIITAALSLIGLIVKLIDAIAGLISKVLNRKIEKLILDDFEYEIRYFASNQGISYAKSLNTFASAIVPAIRALDPICNVLNAHNNGLQTKPLKVSLSKLEEVKSNCEKAYEDAKDARDKYNSEFDHLVKHDENPSKIEPLRYALCRLNTDSIRKLIAYNKDILPKLQEYKNILNTYAENLNKTKVACDKAKSEGNKEIDSSKVSANANEEINKCLKMMQTIIKIAGEFVKMTSEVTTAHQNADKIPDPKN